MQNDISIILISKIGAVYLLVKGLNWQINAQLVLSCSLTVVRVCVFIFACVGVSLSFSKSYLEEKRKARQCFLLACASSVFTGRLEVPNTMYTTLVPHLFNL